MKSKYLIRLISALICLSMMFSLVPVTAAWDGYDRTPNGGNLVKLVDFSRGGDTLTAGALPSTITTGDDLYSVRWRDTKTTTSLKFYNVPRDWSDFNEIRFSVYSDDPTSVASFGVLIYTDILDKDGVTTSYYFSRSPITTNHKGWYEFVLTKDDDIASNNAAGWDKITGIGFSSNWTGCTKSETADFCISSIYGSTDESIPLVKTEPTKSGEAAVMEAIGNNTAIMNYSNNIIKNGEVHHVAVEDRVTTDKSGTIAKFGMFQNALGATISDEGGKVTITLDGVTADVTDNVVTYDDGTYLKVTPTLEALGKTVSYNDMVTIIGDKQAAEKIFDDDLLFEDLKFVLNKALLTAADITQEDWDKAKKQWTEYIIGPQDNLDDPAYKEKVKAAEKEYESNFKNINKDPSILNYFGKTKMTGWSSITGALIKLKSMAKAYAMKGSKYYKDPDAKRAIMEGLEWIYQNVYGLDELINQGTFKQTNDAWSFHIGIPMELTDVILLLGDDISKADIKKYLYVHSQTMHSGPCGPAGRIYAGTLNSILQQDYEELLNRNADYVKYMRSNNYNVYDAIRKGANSAVKEDWMYLTHKFYAYSTAYGCTTLLDRLVTVEGILMGTQFEFVNPFKYDPIMWLKETFGPLVFNGAISSAQSGRFRGDDQYSETTYIRYPIASAIDLIGCFGKDDDEWLKSFVKRNVVKDNEKAIRNFLNSSQIEVLEEIMADDSIKVEPYYNSKVYYTGDSVAHQKGDFGFAVSMSSSRIGGWECINGDNQSGWYQGDGMLFTYVKNDPSQYIRAYWKNVNPYHLPGTTVDTQERIAASSLQSKNTRTSQHFVGGAEFERDYTVAAMQLEGHKNDNPGAVPTFDKDGPLPHHYSSLLAKKAWFLFDDEAVALGTDIHAEDGFEVQTIVENRKLNIEKKLVADIADDVVEYKIVGVDGPIVEAENIPVNTYDGDILTFWAAPGEVEITWEIEKVSPIGVIGIAQRNGTGGKQGIFDLDISVDGKEWTRVFSGKASGQTIELEGYDAGGKQAKFIKYVGHGRTNSKNNVLTEVKFFAPTKDGKSPLAIEAGKDPNEGKILGAEKIIVDGTEMEQASNYKKEFANPKWAHIQDVGGYYFPIGGSLVMDKLTNNSLNFLEMWFTHGVSPTAGEYAYVVLPTKTPEETEKYTKSPDIEILSNTKKLQAVREKTLGMTGIVFWEAGKFENIEVSEPMIMMAKDKDAEGKYKLSITDPTKFLKEGKVTLKGNYEMVDGDKRFTVTNKDGATVISIDFDMAEGRSLPITLLAK